MVANQKGREEGNHFAYRSTFVYPLLLLFSLSAKKKNKTDTFPILLLRGFKREKNSEHCILPDHRNKTPFRSRSKFKKYHHILFYFLLYPPLAAAAAAAAARVIGFWGRGPNKKGPHKSIALWFFCRERTSKNSVLTPFFSKLIHLRLALYSPRNLNLGWSQKDCYDSTLPPHYRISISIWHTHSLPHIPRTGRGKERPPPQKKDQLRFEHIYYGKRQRIKATWSCSTFASICW